MVVEDWSDQIIVARLDNEPGFSEDMQQLRDRLDDHVRDVVIDMAAVANLNSSNLAQLLRVRQQLIEADRALRLASVGDRAMTVLHVTGLDNIFDFAEDITNALAELTMDQQN